MVYLSKRKFIVHTVTFSICLALLVAQGFSLSLERIISRRKSTRSYTSENISGQQLLWVLWAAYGHTNGRRNVPRIGYEDSLIIFPVNETSSYRFIPENNSLVVHDPDVNKSTIPPDRYDGQAWVSTASVVLIVVWNQTKMSNGYFASAEAGCFVQNVYLAAVSLDLGTCCVGDIYPEGLRSDLNLSSNLFPLLVMPLGYPEDPYPPASPYEYTIDNLPPVQYSNSSFEDAVSNIHFAQEWSAEDLSLQELSQLLWAAYGYTNITLGWHKAYHKTTPDSYAWYPLIIYVSNATGVYRYLPDSSPNAVPMPLPNHAVTKILNGDKRLDIANACAGQTWAADAPTIFLIAYNSSYNNGNTGDGGVLPHLFTEVSTGAVIQELILEASAWDLSANVVSEGLEEWNGTGAQELRSILGLPPSAIPLYIVPVGTRSSAEIGHDVAVINVTTSKSGCLGVGDGVPYPVLCQGRTAKVNVTVENQGNNTESFDVTVYANDSIIETYTVINLDPNNQETQIVIWNAAGWAKGNYTIKAVADQVTGEIDLGDNTFVDGWVMVVHPGDLDNSGEVDITDVVMVTGIYRARIGDPDYNACRDVVEDGVIDISDVVAVTAHYREKDCARYTINNGTTWTPLKTTEVSANTRQTTIPGYGNCTWITYARPITLLLSIILSLVSVAFMKLKKKKQ